MTSPIHRLCINYYYYYMNEVDKNHFIFVSAHAGVRGNEHIDRLAGMATVRCGRAMDLADIHCMPSERQGERKM